MKCICTKELVCEGHQEQETKHEAGEDCGYDSCQDCCQHDERDHGICLYCGHETDCSELADFDYDMDR